MTVYQGEEGSIQVSRRPNSTRGVIWINVDGQSVAEIVDINWIDKDKFISELTAVIEKYKI